MRRIGREALILGGFLGFGIWATWPLITNMFSSVTATGDFSQHAWMLWWLKDQLFSLENAYFTDHLFAPVGTYLAYGPLMPLVGAVMAPITALFGAGVARNILTLAVPIASAYIAYRLAMRIGLIRPVAVVTGGLYGFSTMLTERAAAHLNLAAGAVLAPLALLCAIRYYEDQTGRNAVVLGAVLGAAVLVDQQTAMFAAVLAMAYLAAVHVRDRVPWRRWASTLLVATVTGVLVASPQLLMTARQDTIDTPTDINALAPSYKEFNSSLLAMASPSPNLRVAPFEIDELMFRTEVGEGIPAFGWGLLGLAMAGVVLARRRRLVFGLLGIFLVSVLLALGPELTLSNHPYVPLPLTYGERELSGVMPYTWVVRIPGLDELRVAARFTQLALLPAALLAGIGLQGLLRLGRAAKILAAALVTLAVLEIGLPITRDTPQVPLKRDELYAPMKAQGGDSIVVDVPLGFLSGLGNTPGPVATSMEGMLRATEHGKPVATGYLARVAQNRADALLDHRFYTDIIGHQEEDEAHGHLPEDLIAPMDPKAGRMDAREMGIGWVVIWPDPEVSADVRQYVRDVGFRLEQEVDGIELYRAPSAW